MENQLSFQIRPIHENDILGSLSIYRPYVMEGVTSFEYEAPSESEWQKRIEDIIQMYPWLVCELNGRLAGYAYASSHRSRSAYNWSVESTVYIDRNFHGLGIGKALYASLIEILRLQGYRNIYAGITLPNEKSVRLHQSMGFYKVGVFKKIGYKFGSWHDTGWFQMHLDETGEAPGLLKSSAEVQSDPVFHEILNNAAHQLNIKYLENKNK